MKSATADISSFQASAASAFSVAARVAGAVVCAGYLLGVVQGTVVAVVGGLALITFGRNILLSHHEAAISGAALAVIAAALGIAALRWGALDLGELRGVQSVLGPTILVGPIEASVASSLAAAAAVIGLAVWMSRPWPTSKVMFAWWGLEAALGSLALVTLFFEPVGLFGGDGQGLLALVGWVAATALVVAAVAGGGWLLKKASAVVPAVLMAGAGAGVAAGAAILVTVL